MSDVSKKEQKKAAELQAAEKISSKIISCLFHDEEECSWANVIDKGHYETYAIDSPQMRKHLEGLYYLETKRNSGQGEAIPEELLTHFLFSPLRNRLIKSILNRFQISVIWLQAHFEIVEDGLLVGFGCGDFLELHSAHRDLVAADRRQAFDHVAHCPLSIFVSAVGGE
jgi:hypothetical protein